MKAKIFLAAFIAPLLVSAGYSNAQLAGGFAQLVALGRGLEPLLSTQLPEDTLAQLKQLEGCKVIAVESLSARYVGYGIAWKCNRKPKGIKTAAVIKIEDGKIYEVVMARSSFS